MSGTKFVSGGHVQARDGIYIPRRADEELYNLCIEGEYACVMTARQRGKSSLMVNVTNQLKSAGFRVATVDISPFGGTVDEDWFFTILEVIASELKLKLNMVQWWDDQARNYPLASRRFTIFFQEIVLKQIPERVVIFIDEVDKTFTLPFTDDFFINIRALYNSRSQDESLNRLSFVLIGVASPTDLIKAKTSTPYNIGRQIELTDFEVDDLAPFIDGLAKQLKVSDETARVIVRWVYRETQGHPYLTQRLLVEITGRYAPGGSQARSKAAKDLTEADVQDIVRDLFIKPRSGIDNNIAEVKQRMNFAQLESNSAVDLYYRILKVPFIREDQEDLRARTHLKLAGVITTRDGLLEIRNRIYENLFGIDWFTEQYEKHTGRSITELSTKYDPPLQKASPADSANPAFTTYDDWASSLGISADVADFRETSIPDDPRIPDAAAAKSETSPFGDGTFPDFDSFDDDDTDPFTESETDTDAASKSTPVAPPAGGSLLGRMTPPKAGSSSGGAGVKRPSGTKNDDAYADLKSRVQNKLLAELDPIHDMRSSEFRMQIENLFNAILAEEYIVLSRAEKSRLFDAIIADILGFGPLEALLSDEAVTMIMVNGPKNVFVEIRGRLTRSNVTFDNDEHVLRVLDRIVAPLGRRIDESSPYVSARLPDGSTVNAVIRPISLAGPSIVIRKFSKRPFTIEDLIRFGALTVEVTEFLRACVISGINMLILGSVGGGEITLMNALSGFIPNDERLISVERTAWLQLYQEHVLTLETRPPNIEGRGEVSFRDLTELALNLYPDRIIFGDVTPESAAAYINASLRVNTMATMLAQSVEAALNTLETGIMETVLHNSVEAMRDRIIGALPLIVFIQRLRDGTRKITKIVEVTRLAPGRYGLDPIFQFEQTGIERGKIIGRISPTGHRPTFLSQVEDAGIHLPPSVFGVGSRRMR
jgi:pilus assembly protein CpaF